MDTMFMNSKNSGTSDPHRLLLNLTEKINLKRSTNYVWKKITTFFKRRVSIIL